MTDATLELLRAPDHFVLTTHIRPDGDAIGSELGLGRFLEKKGKKVTILNSDPLPSHLEWLPGTERIEVFDGSFSQRKALAEADVAVVLDTNAEERLGDLGKPLRRCGATTLLVDHHTGPEDWFDHSYHRDTAAATGELLYELIQADRPELIDADIATTLYTAIMTDTGSFRYNSVTPTIHRIVADLLERGCIEPAPIHTALFDNRPLAALRLLGRALDRLQLRYNGAVGYTVVTYDMLQAAGATSDDKNGLVSYVLSVEGVKAALLFSEASGGTKISFRSEGDTHVNEWASAFGGGGHRNASGAYVERPLSETIAVVMDAAPQFIDLASETGEPTAAGSTTADGTSSPDELSEADRAYLQTMLEQKSDQPENASS